MSVEKSRLTPKQTRRARIAGITFGVLAPVVPMVVSTYDSLAGEEARLTAEAAAKAGTPVDRDAVAAAQDVQANFIEDLDDDVAGQLNNSTVVESITIPIPEEVQKAQGIINRYNTYNKVFEAEKDRNGATSRETRNALLRAAWIPIVAAEAAGVVFYIKRRSKKSGESGLITGQVPDPEEQIREIMADPRGFVNKARAEARGSRSRRRGTR